eukprot:TRINITY_DN6498_c0_g1_i1.p1 TRINITY_DN6498_c0_g1~~TRINITY_DN6498_c0_g1_i1.p1  ORF type:complete len:207 (+),score=69.79 TRINITY_DN6498_c0_g1_i1:19-639(+)
MPKQSKFTEEEKALQLKYNELRKFKKGQEKGTSKAKTQKASLEAAKKVLAAESMKGSNPVKNAGFKQAVRRSRATQSQVPSTPMDTSSKTPNSTAQKTEEKSSASSDVRSAASQGAQEEEQRIVCITDLPEGIEETKLRKSFSKFGALERIEPFFDQHYALLYYLNEESANAALSMDGQPYEGADHINVYKPSLQDPEWKGENENQ